jgi:bacterioferritin
VVTTKDSQPFLTDVKELRRRAKEQMDKGAVTTDYSLDPKQAVDLLQNALATEIVCVLRYTMHSIAAAGINSQGAKDQFSEHAQEEKEHMQRIAERINQLGGTPNFNPEGLASRSASEYGKGELDLVGMIQENLVAERIAIEHYRELVNFFGDKDPTTRKMMEEILAVEEEHANDMVDLLAVHAG